MQNWKSWQFVFLAYLLLLNVIVLGSLAYVVLRNDFWLSPQPTSAAVASGPLDSPTSTSRPTLTPAPSPTTILLPANQTEADESSKIENTATPTPIPPINIPPAPLPSKAISNVTTLEAQSVVIPTATPMSTPTYTPSSTSTPTNTPRPTATSTNTPRPTATPTNTPHPTATPMAMPSNTPRPSATPTATLTNTPQPTPTPTATSTNTPRSTPTATFTLTPRPTHTNTPLPTSTTILSRQASTPIAVASSSLSADRPVQPDQAPTRALKIEAIPLTNGSIALSWEPVDKALQYRIYSDMGSGYGVYIYKTHTSIQPAFVDEMLRPGMTYSYRITHLEAGQEIVLAQAKAATFGDETTSGNTRAGQTNISSVSVVPEPTTLPPDTVLLGLLSQNNFTDNFNTLTIAGEVRNDSNQDVGQTNITITFYDAAGAIIDMAHGETMLEVIPPGETSPFLITLTRPTGLASYSVRAVARPVTPRSKAQLAVVEVKRFEDEAGFFHIKGVIQNVGNIVAKRTKVAAVIYGRDGRVINVGFTYVTPPNLAPGEQASYDVIFTYYPGYFNQAVVPFEE
jgi:hypothetical protein